MSVRKRHGLRAVVACIDRHSAAGWAAMAIIWLVWLTLMHGASFWGRG